jgi:hypothetical protein
MKTHPTVGETFAALQALDPEVHKNSHALDQWCIQMKRSKANQPALLLMLMTRQVNEKLMRRLWLAERNAIDARHESRMAQHEIEEWQFTTLLESDPVSDSLH